MMQKKRIYFWVGSFVLSLVAFSWSLSAVELDDARSKGWVCEGVDGYLQARSSQAQDLVNNINEQRRTEYQDIAKQQGVSIEDAARVAGQRLQSKGGC